MPAAGGLVPVMIGPTIFQVSRADSAVHLVERRLLVRPRRFDAADNPIAYPMSSTTRATSSSISSISGKR
jgi:hypothetical protein